MENLKHTKEYAEELFKFRTSKKELTEGYMKAIEETGVADLLEFIQRMVDEDNFVGGYEEEAIELINKATK